MMEEKLHTATLDIVTARPGIGAQQVIRSAHE